MAPERQEKMAVRCRGLAKTFGTGENAVRALRGVDLDVGFGELVMLVGPSGCGKTTLISVVASVLDQDDGVCEVLGADLASLSPADKTRLRRSEIGFVFQSYNLIPSLSVIENVAVPLLLNGRRRTGALAAARSMLDLLGIGARADARPDDLSGGQQQRVAVARALVHEPRILVCDEPTSALDAKTGERLLQLLRDVALDSGRALIVVTHDNRILKYADWIAEMDDGRVVRVHPGASSHLGAPGSAAP
jgi:putative ABC transport system ATP-binding protein